MKRFCKLFTTSFSLWIVVTFVGCDFPSRSKHVSSSRQIKVERHDLIQTVTVAGNVIPERKAEVTAPFAGYVHKMFVKVGDRVKAGDPIVSVSQTLQSSDVIFPLRAPFAGVVVQVEKTAGEFVRAADVRDTLVRIDKLDTLYALASVPEITRVKLHEGQEAVLRVNALLGQAFKGVVESIALAAKAKEEWANSANVEYMARIRIVDAGTRLLPGMSVIADIMAGRDNGVLALPHEFVLRERESAYVLLPDGQRRKVETGKENEEYVEIVNGISEGEAVNQVNYLELAPEPQ